MPRVFNHCLLLTTHCLLLTSYFLLLTHLESGEAQMAVARDRLCAQEVVVEFLDGGGIDLLETSLHVGHHLASTCNTPRAISAVDTYTSAINYVSTHYLLLTTYTSIPIRQLSTTCLLTTYYSLPIHLYLYVSYQLSVYSLLTTHYLYIYTYTSAIN